MPDFISDWLHEAFGEHPAGILLLGLGGQVLFASRFLVQWVASERAGRSLVPPVFWWLSLTGSTLVLAYGLITREPVIILGQAGIFIYLRNLMLIQRQRRAGGGSSA